MSERDLGIGIIKQALRDATISTDNFIRRDGRNFLRGSTQSWLESLHDVCALAGLNPYRIRKKALEWDKYGWPSTKYINRLIKEIY